MGPAGVREVDRGCQNGHCGAGFKEPCVCCISRVRGHESGWVAVLLLPSPGSACGSRGRGPAMHRAALVGRVGRGAAHLERGVGVVGVVEVVVRRGERDGNLVGTNGGVVGVSCSGLREVGQHSVLGRRGLHPEERWSGRMRKCVGGRGTLRGGRGRGRHCRPAAARGLCSFIESATQGGRHPM